MPWDSEKLSPSEEKKQECYLLNKPMPNRARIQRNALQKKNEKKIRQFWDFSPFSTARHATGTTHLELV